MTVAALVTFTSSANAEELSGVSEQFSYALLDVAGLISKTWLSLEGGSGGFYLFTDENALAAFLNGPLVAQLRAHPQFSDFQVNRFGVDDELSRRTGALPSSAADE